MKRETVFLPLHHVVFSYNDAALYSKRCVCHCWPSGACFALAKDRDITHGFREKRTPRK